MASIGTLSVTSSTDFTPSKTFTGTAATDDWFDLTGNTSPLFTELYLNPQGDLTYSVIAPTLNKSATHTIAFANPATAVDGYLRSGLTNDAYNGLFLYKAPGDYNTENGVYAIYGTSGNDTSIAPSASTKGIGLQGWDGDDRLIGGAGPNTIVGGSGNNQLSGKNGADVYRTKTAYLANDTILDDGDDAELDVIQVLLSTRTNWDWAFEKIGNDLKGFVSDRDGIYNFTVKDHYLSPNAGIEGVSLYSIDTSAVWRGVAFKTNTPTYGNFAEAGTAENNTFTPSSLGLGIEKTGYRAWGNGGNDALSRIDNKAIYTFFDGGSGIDTVSYAQGRSDYVLTKYAATAKFPGFTVKNNLAATTTSPDDMRNVERFHFSDKKIALDLDGNAGTVAKVLGAVFGKSAVNNKEYVGIGLSFLDSGMNASALGELAIKAAGATTNDGIVEKLYTNVVGFTPTAAEKSPFVQMLNSGTSVGDLVMLAADTPLNQTNIGLTGLVTEGIEYI